MKRISFFILFLFTLQLLQSQEVKVEAWLDSNRILVGDQINFNVLISHPENIEILYPEVKDTLISGVEILRTVGPDTLSVRNNNVELGMTFLITSFDTGFYEIPPLYAEQSSQSGIKRYYSDYNGLEVLRTNIAPADTASVIFDIAGPRKARITIMEVLPWVLLLAAIILISIYLFRYFSRRSKPEQDDTTYLTEEPIHIIALRDLDKLEKKEFWQKSHHKKYYSILTEILRTYLDRRYGISSLEKTTGETLDSLLEKGFDTGELYSLLEELLITADLSKFAKHKPPDAVNIKALEETRRFIKSTCQINSSVNGIDEQEDRKEVADE